MRLKMVVFEIQILEQRSLSTMSSLKKGQGTTHKREYLQHQARVYMASFGTVRLVEQSASPRGLVVNGDWKVGNYLIGDESEANAASQTYIAELNEGEEVGIQTYEDETYMGGEKISAFAGFKL